MMLFDSDLTGQALPLQTLCLTFDDGPGPETAALGAYLASQAIAATFFLIGTHARGRPGVVPELRAQGRLVANHTDTHPHLVAFHRDGGDTIGELTRTGTAGLTFFRPPDGDWRDEPDRTHSTVAAALNDSGLFPDLVGPVGWDIDARDWWFWREQRPAEEAGQAYLDAIQASGRGIVLLHDSGEPRPLRAGNRCLALVRWLVPILHDHGFGFVRLDAVPAIAAILPSHPHPMLQPHPTRSGRW